VHVRPGARSGTEDGGDFEEFIPQYADSSLSYCLIRGSEYHPGVIRGFGDKETGKIFNLIVSRKIPRDIQERSYHKLVAIHEAESLDNLRTPPGNRLEPLRGALDGFHSIRINKQWRIIFRWEGKDAHDVKIADYH